MLVKCSTTAAQSFLQCFDGEVFGQYTEDLCCLYVPMEDDDDGVFSLFEEDIQLIRSSWPLPVPNEVIITSIQVNIQPQEEE